MYQRMKNNKIPELNGLPLEFYKLFWNGKDPAHWVLEFIFIKGNYTVKNIDSEMNANYAYYNDAL